MIKEMTFEDYWNEVGRYFGVQDTITMVDGDGDWEGDSVIEFRDSCGYLISSYNTDRGIVEYHNR